MRIPLFLAAAGLVGIAPATASHRQLTAAHAASTHTVRMGEYFYRPKALTIHVGDRVRFLNVGKIEHTVADSTKNGRILSRLIKPRPLKHGKSQTVTFTRPGRVYYRCTFHPKLMHGVVRVRR